LQVKELKKIHLSNFRKKFDDKSYQVVKDAIGKNAFLASEINVNKIIDNISDPDVKNKFKAWSNGYDFAVLS
jgi:hypothetical protein